MDYSLYLKYHYNLNLGKSVFEVAYQKENTNIYRKEIEHIKFFNVYTKCSLKYKLQKMRFMYINIASTQFYFVMHKQVMLVLRTLLGYVKLLFRLFVNYLNY